MLKRHINVCTGGDLCSPFFSNFSETPCMKVGFDVKTLPLLAGNSLLGPVCMIPGQLIASGQLTDPGVNFASVHGLTSVTVHMNLSLPRGNFERCVTHCNQAGFYLLGGREASPSKVLLKKKIYSYFK